MAWSQVQLFAHFASKWPEIWLNSVILCVKNTQNYTKFNKDVSKVTSIDILLKSVIFMTARNEVSNILFIHSTSYKESQIYSTYLSTRTNKTDVHVFSWTRSALGSKQNQILPWTIIRISKNPENNREVRPRGRYRPTTLHVPVTDVNLNFDYNYYYNFSLTHP